MDDPFFTNQDNDEIDSSLRGKYKNSWVEESFNFEKDTERQVAVKTTNNYLGCIIENKRLKIVFTCMFFGLLFLFSRIFYLQTIKGEEFRSEAEGNRIRISSIPAERGVILDSFNNELVQNIPSFTLSVIENDLPKNNKDRIEVMKRLSEVSGKSEEELRELFAKYRDFSYQSLVLKENLDYQTALELYLENVDLPGVVLESTTKRKYLNIDVLSLSHILGYVGKLNYEELQSNQAQGYIPSDIIGKIGLEKSYEEILRGIYGKKEVEVNAFGRELNTLTEDAPIPGKNIVLSLDLEAQKKLEELMKQYLQKFNKKKGVAIALSPQNGEILALVSWPTFDNNDFSGGITVEKYQEYLENKNNPLFNRAISGTYPSGSTVKMVVAAGALEEGVITENTTVNSVGGIWIDRWYFKDWRAGGHGVTNVTKALAWSVNTFFYYIGGGYKDFDGLGLEKILEYMKRFNLSKQTGIDLPGEVSGFLPSEEWKQEKKDEIWYIGDTYNLSIGQGDLSVTPLQVAVWTSAVANGGSVLKPKLVKKIIDPSSKTEKIIEKEVLNENVVSAYNMGIVKKGMKECVTLGSCKLLGYLPFDSGGKTGTAQWSSTKEPHAWFTAFAPYSNPQIVITVLVEEGEGGSVTSMPIAYDFLRWWGVKYLGN